MTKHPFIARADEAEVRSKRLVRRSLLLAVSSLIVVVVYVAALYLVGNVVDFLYAAWGLQIAAVLAGVASIYAKRSANRWRKWYGEVKEAYPRLRL